MFVNLTSEACGEGFNLTCNLTSACNGTWVDGQCLDEDLDPFAMPSWRKVIWSIFFFIMVATADIGNMIVIWIVMSNARMRSVTNYFIINLSMADIINATFNVIPNFVYMLTGNWPFGYIFCKLGGCISILSVSVSVFTLVAISVDRYNAIIKPLKPRLSKLKTTMIASLTWCLGLSVGTPMVIFFTTVSDPSDLQNRTQCISEWPDAVGYYSKLEYGYNVSFMIMTYFLPMISMCYTYARVGLELWGSRAIGEFSEAQAESIKSKRKVVKMMMGVVTIFLVCWLPYHTYFITANLYPSINYSHYIQEIYLMIYWLAMSNSMYNPMIYCYMNQRFRKGFMKVWNVLLCNKKTELERKHWQEMSQDKVRNRTNLAVPARTKGHQNGFAGGFSKGGIGKDNPQFTSSLANLPQLTIKLSNVEVSENSCFPEDYSQFPPDFALSPENLPRFSPNPVCCENYNGSSENSNAPLSSLTPSITYSPAEEHPSRPANNSINIGTFLRVVRVVKVDSLQVNICENSSDETIQEVPEDKESSSSDSELDVSLLKRRESESEHDALIFKGSENKMKEKIDGGRRTTPCLKLAQGQHSDKRKERLV